MRVLKGLLLVFACLVMLPAAAFAQASITGVVKDASGAVLPGVTVEASSDALIEKVRSAVTDGGGQYRIVDLRAGTYAVTFSLTGFSSVKREGVELTGSFTATINADMKVGTLAGDDHRHRRDADRRHAERPAADDHLERVDLEHAGLEVLRRRDDADSGDDHAGRRQPRHPGDARDAGVRRRGRPEQRSAPAGGRLEHRRGVQRRRRVELRARHRQRAGNLHDDVGRHGRSRSRRTVVQHRAEDRRQLVQGHVLRLVRHRAGWSATTTRTT